MTQPLIRGATRLLLGFAGPNSAAGSAGQSNQAGPPQPFTQRDTEEEWFKLFAMAGAALFAFFWSGFAFIRCFELPPPGGGPPGQLAFNVMAYGLCGLTVVCSAACLIALAVKVCLQVIRE